MNQGNNNPNKKNDFTLLQPDNSDPLGVFGGPDPMTQSQMVNNTNTPNYPLWNDNPQQPNINQYPMQMSNSTMSAPKGQINEKPQMQQSNAMNNYPQMPLQQQQPPMQGQPQPMYYLPIPQQQQQKPMYYQQPPQQMSMYPQQQQPGQQPQPMYYPQPIQGQPMNQSQPGTYAYKPPAQGQPGQPGQPQTYAYVPNSSVYQQPPAQMTPGYIPTGQTVIVNPMPIYAPMNGKPSCGQCRGTGINRTGTRCSCTINSGVDMMLGFGIGMGMLGGFGHHHHYGHHHHHHGFW